MLRPLLAALALATSISAAAAAPDAPAVLVVQGGRYLGSAVVWDAASRRVLTALHVVEEMPPDRIEVVVDGVARSARVVDREPLLDLALLEVAGPLRAGPPLGAAAALLPGDAVAIAGCPQVACAQGDGRVVAASRAFAGSRYLAVSAEVRPGASGGPVLDARGALVGIVDLALVREPGVALAVPVERAAARFPRG